MSKSTLKEFLTITEDLDNLLSEKLVLENRGQLIAQLNDFIEIRGKLIQQLAPPFTEEEQMIGQKIVTLNKKVQKQMDSLYNGLKVEMKQINKQKKSAKSYENPFESVQLMDGMFLDQKK